MKIKYKIIWANWESDLAEEVEDHFAQGWKFVAGFTISDGIFYQPMYLELPDLDKE